MEHVRVQLWFTSVLGYQHPVPLAERKICRFLATHRRHQTSICVYTYMYLWMHVYVYLYVHWSPKVFDDCSQHTQLFHGESFYARSRFSFFLQKWFNQERVHSCFFSALKENVRSTKRALLILFGKLVTVVYFAGKLEYDAFFTHCTLSDFIKIMIKILGLIENLF